MKRSITIGVLAVAVLIAFMMGVFPHLVTGAEKMKMPFGGDHDVEFANKLWKAMKGYPDWIIKSDVYVGKSPHGAFLRMYYNVVIVDGKPYHIIVKDNFMGKGADGKEVGLKTVAKSPMKYLAAVTIMLQREAGYDPDNNNWFWVKYKADGSIDKNPKGMALAGRVAKGMDAGCIACHKGAKDDDYVFVNDGEM